jgi:hypothetical protein
MYLKSADGFEGQGPFFSKFGLQIDDQAVFTVSRRIFAQVVAPMAGIQRPNEGDLIYYPLAQKLFQISFVDYLPVHYPLGSLYTWDLTIKLFDYSNETMNTGIPAIDAIQTQFSTNILDYALVDENGT